MPNRALHAHPSVEPSELCSLDDPPWNCGPRPRGGVFDGHQGPASSLPENETRKQIYNRSHALQHGHLVAATEQPREVVETLILLLSPFAPHIAEELWGKLGHEGTLAFVPWPSFDPELGQEEMREYVVQINGKVRHRFEAAADLGDGLLEAARSEPVVAALLAGRTVVKEIAVPGRLVNFVARE
jgi:leucyl-tRNA synthetase